MSKIIKERYKLPKDMDNKSILKSFIARGAVIYTALSTCLIALSMLVSENASVKILVPKQFLFLLLFSFLLSLGGVFLKLTALPSVWPRVLHALCFIGGFALFLLLCGVKFAPLIISDAVFAAFYVVITLILMRKKSSPSTAPEKKNNKKTKNVEYTPMFPSRSNSQKDYKK